MTDAYLRNIITECKSVAYYLPSIETQVSKEVASEILRHLKNIEFLTKHLNQSETEALRYLNEGSSHHRSKVKDE